MNNRIRGLAVSVMIVASSTALADITFFQSSDFSGRRVSFEGPTASFRDAAFNDQANSAIVRGESWEVCVDSNFRGGCSILEPGRYPTLGQWSNLISSARPVSSPTAASPSPMPAAVAAIGTITFFEDGNFGGRRLTIDQQFPDLSAAGFDAQVLSAIVEGIPWEVCADAGYRDCRILPPGRYPFLADFGGRISSARPSSPPREVPRARPVPRASATLFSGPNLTGQAFTLGGEGASNLDGLFNDRASSLRVERGYWIFCSDANFRGECRTFGPGEYQFLPPELDGRISSGRRIANNYPYSGNPNWR
jgi:hypothetical protein